MATKKGKKFTGRKYSKERKKKKYEVAGQKRIVKIGEENKRKIRVRGGNKKTYFLNSKFINVKTKQGIKKTTIRNVLETPSNKFLARQNVLSKGTIIETEIGKARITNRPSQEGVINGVLVE